jgi:16S rRNA (cytidine1402-2'-O)-methyltransferase
VAGTLFVVATPLGNFEDITYRAVRTLGECDAIACEDTRHSRKLLDHFGIRKPVFSLHDHNEQARVEELLGRLAAGERVAVISDAGTPLISDPGYRIVEAAVEAGFAVVPIPGPSAITAALSAAGLPTDRFYFGGFLPARSTARAAELEARIEEEATLVYFESPHRILDTLADIERLMPGRSVTAARELTKLHEEFLRGSAGKIREELALRPQILGEFTLLVAKQAKTRSLPPEAEIRRQVKERIRSGEDRKTAMKAVAKRIGIGKADVYRLLLEENQSPGTGGSASG